MLKKKYTFIVFAFLLHNTIFSAASAGKRLSERKIDLVKEHTCCFCNETFKGFAWIAHLNDYRFKKKSDKQGDEIFVHRECYKCRK